MERNLAIYLRTHRRRWGLNEHELARLLGFKSGSHVSRLEHGQRQPTFPVIVACTLIFGVQANKLFPAIVHEVEEQTVRNAYELYLELQGDSSKATKIKLDLLEKVLARAEARADEHGRRP